MNRSWLIAVPSSITLGSIFSGFLSMLLADTRPWAAGACICVASVCDMVDGRLARMTGTQSKFGAELDSLADIIAFGLAPAWLVYRWQNPGGAVDPAWVALTFAFVACGAIRLARFNVIHAGHGPTRVFQGVPIPSAALLCTGLVMMQQELGLDVLRRPAVAAPIVALAAGAMLSPWPFPSYKKFGSRAAQIAFYACVVTGLVLLVVGGAGTVLFGLMATYFTLGAALGPSAARIDAQQEEAHGP